MKLDMIYNEDCLEGMKKLPDNSVDLVATDPPYGIAFMGKRWDRAIPSIDIWREVLRVLKPGAFAFVMCIPRQDCLARMIVSLEDAGFNVSFSSIFHTFAQGFPKAQNIGKVVDKRLGAEGEVVGQKVRGDVEKAKRSGTTFAVADANKNNKDIFGYGIEDITIPATPQAQALDGSYAGFQPKPAVEVILVAMKPLSEKTYVDQALRNGKGISWLDGGRIPYKAQEDIDEASNKNRHADFGSGPRDNKVYGADKRSRAKQGNYDALRGRFPANLLVSDDALNDGRIRISRSCKTHTGQGGKGTSEFSKCRSGGKVVSRYIGECSFSRYFSLDAWFDKKLKELPEGVQKTFPFLIVPKASKAEKNRGCEGLPDKMSTSHKGRYRICRKCGKRAMSGTKEQVQYRCQCSNPEWEYVKTDGKRYIIKNYHPTVKPLKLFSYLITLGSREGDIILDPFIGSGTTAIAAVMTGRHYIGWDTEEEYVKITRARLSAVQMELL